ncbi:MAG TPA: hypothetical protein VF784_10330 [Anaerolineales bacterium]
MKQLVVLVLALALTGCAAIAPAVPTPGPVSTPQVIIQTVIVTVLITAPATQTPIPTSTWTPIPTFTPQPTSLTATAGTPQVAATGPTRTAGSGSPTATLPANAGGGLFTNLTRSTDQFAVNCPPNDITLGLSSTDPSVTEVDLFYRLEDKHGSSMTGWVDIGPMASNNAGNFTFDFKATLIPTDVRFSQAWFDYQFVALNKSLKVVGRSATILQQVTFSVNCPT